MRRFLTVVFLTLAAVPVLAADDERVALVRNAVETVIRPGYAAFAEASKVMAGAADRLCEAPSAETLKAARDAFAGTVATWSRIEYVQFGPVREGNRLERILFFPDRKGIALKQVQAWIGKPEAAAADPAAMAGKSAAVQGLPALEFVLFGTGADGLAEKTGTEWRCVIGESIAGNLSEMAAELVEDWADGKGIRFQLENPGAGNLLYRDGGEALAQVLKVLPNGYELMAETRLKPFLGENPDAAKPKAALFWRSGLTGLSLAENLKGLQALASVEGLAEGLSEDVEGWAPSNLSFETMAALSLLEKSDKPLDQVAVTAEGHARLSQLVRQLDNLREVATTGILGGYGLAAGFSSLDGD